MLKLIEAGREKKTKVGRRSAKLRRNEDHLVVSHVDLQPPTTSEDWTVDDDAASNSTVTFDGGSELGDPMWNPLAAATRISQHLFVPEVIGGDNSDSRLTVEDIYICLLYTSPSPRD